VFQGGADTTKGAPLSAAAASSSQALLPLPGGRCRQVGLYSLSYHFIIIGKGFTQNYGSLEKSVGKMKKDFAGLEKILK
jgi:hypothetical protein